MKNLGWAIIGPGRIAHRFAEAVNKTDNTHIAMVQGRDAARSRAFADAWRHDGGAAIATTLNIDDVLNATNVDAVYIASPHAFHADAIRRCLIAGKPVLCEKPLVTDARTAKALIELSRQHNTFLMEAVWTRFLPIYSVVRDWLQSNKIGAVKSMQSSFCFNAPWDAASRLFDPALAGGSLLDIGIYNLNVTRWVMQAAFGNCPEPDRIAAFAKMGPTGVDHSVSAMIHFPTGVTSQFICSIESAGENTFQIHGERGTIIIHKYFSAATRATLSRTNEDAITIERPWRVNGFEGEIEETMRVIAAGKIESDIMPHEETRQTLVWIDQMRRDIGLRYPFESAAK
jgi:predicted dehydrogenase